MANPVTEASGSVETAAEAFGSLLEQEPEFAPEPKEAPEAREDVSEESLDSEQSDDTEDEIVESEASDEESEGVSYDSESESEETTKFERLSELAEALEMPLDEFMASIKTTRKVNGEEQEVTLQELLNGNMMEADYRQKTATLAEQRRAFEEQAQAKLQELNDKAQSALDVTALLENQLVEEYNSVNWDEIRRESPAEYAALQQDYQSRAAALQNMRDQATQNAEFVRKETLEKQVEIHQKILQEEGAKLIEAIPEWMDKDKAQKGKSEIAAYLKGYGFGDQELNNLIDHRSVVLARKAMLYDQMNKTAKVAEKKVSKLPKILKPGAKRGKAEIQSAKRSEQIKRLQKTGHINEAKDVFLDMLNNED